MDFPEVLRKRVMVRGYTDQPVSDDAITRVLRAAQRAPERGIQPGTPARDRDERRPAAGGGQDQRRPLHRTGLLAVDLAGPDAYLPLHKRALVSRALRGYRGGIGGDRVAGSVLVVRLRCDVHAAPAGGDHERLATGFFSAVHPGELDALGTSGGSHHGCLAGRGDHVGHPTATSRSRRSRRPSRLPIDDIVQWRR